MKLLTTNYLTCAIKACRTSPLSFPLHFKDAELVQETLEANPTFIRNILPRIEWPALVTTATEVSFCVWDLSGRGMRGGPEGANPMGFTARLHDVAAHEARGGRVDG